MLYKQGGVWNPIYHTYLKQSGEWLGMTAWVKYGNRWRIVASEDEGQRYTLTVSTNSSEYGYNPQKKTSRYHLVVKNQNGDTSWHINYFGNKADEVRKKCREGDRVLLKIGGLGRTKIKQCFNEIK